MRAEFEAEMLSQRQTSPAAKKSKPRELYYAVSMNHGDMATRPACLTE